MIIKQTKTISPFQVATTYIGTIVGAGFASGQETLKFFTYYGNSGLLGIIISTVCFCLLGVTIMYVGRKYHALSHKDIFIATCGKPLGKLIDIIVTIFLLATLAVMLAGAGAVFYEHLAMNRFIGIFLTCLLCAITMYYGIDGVLAANTFLVPILLAMVLGISLYSINYHGLNLQVMDHYQTSQGVGSNWVMSAFLYASYNLILATTVLGPLGSQIQSKKTLVLGGILGGLGLGVLSLVMSVVVLLHFPKIADYEIPMLFIVSPYATGLKLLFTLILWSEIFTTLIGTLYGVGLRLSGLIKLDYRIIACVCLLLSALFSNIGFSNLVGFVYPMLGYVSLIFIVGLVLVPIRKLAIHR